MTNGYETCPHCGHDTKHPERHSTRCNGEVREEILQFARAIEATMRKNEKRGKGDEWKTCGAGLLWDKLDEEYLEATAAWRSSWGQPDPDEFLDLACVAMFLWHRSGVQA